MRKLLEQLDAIKAIVDTVNPIQILNEPSNVANQYEIYARTYYCREKVTQIKDRLIKILRSETKVVNGYLSANFGYGKTATLVYLWHCCRAKKIAAVPPFKFKEIRDLLIVSYGWMRYTLEHSEPKLLPQLEESYTRHSQKSKEKKASEIATKHNISESKAKSIVQDLGTDSVSTDTILEFWRETIPLIQEAGFSGLAIFADESQEFLRQRGESDQRIQLLSDLIKGMRGLSNVPVSFLLSMPTNPTESAIEEQSADIIHRMKEQHVYLRLDEAYDHHFPQQLWDFLCDGFLDTSYNQNNLVHPATLESLGQLCDRKDLSNGPRAVVEVFKRLIHFAHDQQKPYTPLDLSHDYLNTIVQLYGTEQHRIRESFQKLMQQPLVQAHSDGEKVAQLLAIFPNGVTTKTAQEFGLLDSLKELAEKGNLYGDFITETSSDRYALAKLLETSSAPTLLDEILNRFRQRWFTQWGVQKKSQVANQVFRQEILKIILPPSAKGQRGNWTWPSNWKEDLGGFYTILRGSPDNLTNEFPYRKLSVAVGTVDSKLMQLKISEPTHLDWRFYLAYDHQDNLKSTQPTQKITAIAGTGQVDFHLQLGRSFAKDYPNAFGLLKKVIAPEQCSACTLLNLSQFIQQWLKQHPEVSQSDRERLIQHRKECHQYALQLLFPVIDELNWLVEGLTNIQGTEGKLIESIFITQMKIRFPHYKSFNNHINSTLVKYKSVLGSISLAERRGCQLFTQPKKEFEKAFNISGSGLNNLLSNFKQYELISDIKIASGKDEESQIRFLSHPLEDYIKQEIATTGEIYTPENHHGYQDLEVKSMSYQELWKRAELRGYLEEEFDTALDWLKLRNYIEQDKVRGLIYQATTELNSNNLSEDLSTLLDAITKLQNIFNDQVLISLMQDLKLSQQQLLDAKEDEVILDQTSRKIKSCRDQLSGFKSAKLSGLKEEVNRLKEQIRGLPRDLISSKVNQSLEGSSGLELRLNDYRKGLARSVNRLERECQNYSTTLRIEESDLYQLKATVQSSQQKFQELKKNKDNLNPLIQGLEEWRIIITQASQLRERISNDHKKLQEYDDFLDRVITHFDQYQTSSFREYEKLVVPLKQIEVTVKQEESLRRQQFDQALTNHESSLGMILSSDRHLRSLCRFDNEDEQGSYETLRTVVQKKIIDWCDEEYKQSEDLHNNLRFLSQEGNADVQDLLQDIQEKQKVFLDQQKKVSENLDHKTQLDGIIQALKLFHDDIQALQTEYRKRQFKKNELTEPEQDFLKHIENGMSISQLQGRVDNPRDLWVMIQSLYSKGYIESKIFLRS